MTRPAHPPPDLEHDVANIRGLMLAASLSAPALAVLLGGVSVHEAEGYKGDAIGRLWGLSARIRQARQ